MFSLIITVSLVTMKLTGYLDVSWFLIIAPAAAAFEAFIMGSKI